MPKNKYYYSASTIILVALLSVGLVGSMQWQKTNLKRELVHQSVAINEDLSYVFYAGCRFEETPFNYYMRKYNLQDRAFCLYGVEKNKIDEIIFEKIPKKSLFAIVEKVKDGSVPRRSFYNLGNSDFEVVKIYQRNVAIGPYPFLKNLMGFSTTSIIIYLCRNE